jgi:hypothetical protein
MKNRITLIMLALTLSCLSGWGADVVTARRSTQVISVAPVPNESGIQQMPGFPITLEPHDPISPHEDLRAPHNLYGVVLADLDGNGDLEVVFSSASCSGGNCNRGRIWAWDSQGISLSGFPFVTFGGAGFAPSVADLDGDGDQEIVQVTMDSIRSTRLYVLDHLGEVLSGFPVKISLGVGPATGTTLYDLDQDGILEIIYASADYQLRVFETDGSEWQDGWPIPMVFTGVTPAVGDVDGDGAPEIFIKGIDQMHLIRADGSEVEGWPRPPLTEILVVWSSAALADLDHDDDLEIVLAGLPSASSSDEPYPAEVHVYHHDGSPMAGWPLAIDYHDFNDCQPLVTDLEGDGELEIVYASGSDSMQAVIYAWDAAGQARPGFPFHSESLGNRIFLLTAADYDGDGRVEIFADSEMAYPDWDGEGFIYGIDADGNELPGFPLRPHGLTGLNGAIIGDVDQDGDYELGAVSLDLQNDVTRINLYDLPGRAMESNGDWLTYHAANGRGGLQRRQYRGWRFVYAGARRHR